MLTPEQEKLLQMLVEAARSLKGDDRRAFQAHKNSDSGINKYEIFHRGFPEYKRPVYRGDLDELENQGLIRYTSHHRTMFDVTNTGHETYQEIKERDGNPLAEVESTLLRYLEDASFQQRFPLAYDKWMRAAHALVSTDADTRFTQIGHDCREAMQEFVTSLVSEFRPANADGDKARTVSRIRAVLELRKSEIGNSTHAFLDALVSYWGTVSDLAQRQEHGGQREGNVLTWEDARRVVFHTGIVMFEFDRSLHRRA